MYEIFYGFREKPFNLTPDPKYLFLSQRHTEAIAHLEFGRRERGGFAVITGEVGTGKTTLARSFLARLGEGTATAVVLYPALTAAELLRSTLDDLHVTASGDSLKDLVDALHRFLLEARAQKREVVLLIDEAQDLSPEVLEQIRLLSNLETDTEKLIQIVLMGQSELAEMLARRELRQLAQRVTARYHLAPLDAAETADYIRHRIAVAGGDGKVAFTAGALAAVHRASRGVPRLVNLICDRALLAGYVKSTRTVDAAMVRRAARELGGPVTTRPRLAGYAVAGLGAAATLLAAAFWVPGVAHAPDAMRAETRPSAAPAAAPSPAASTSPTALTGALETLILALPHDGSLQSAAGEIEARWGRGALERTPARTQLEQLRRLDMPAVLEMFHPARRDTCYVALVGLDADQALVSTGGTELLVPAAELERHWTHQAVFLWRDFESLGRSEGGRTDAWVRGALERLGYGEAQTDLTSAVSRFQRDADIAADGVVGSRTLLALYSRGDYARPRLAPGGAS